KRDDHDFQAPSIICQADWVLFEQFTDANIGLPVDAVQHHPLVSGRWRQIESLCRRLGRGIDSAWPVTSRSNVVFSFSKCGHEWPPLAQPASVLILYGVFERNTSQAHATLLNTSATLTRQPESAGPKQPMMAVAAPKPGPHQSASPGTMSGPRSA